MVVCFENQEHKTPENNRSRGGHPCPNKPEGVVYIPERVLGEYGQWR